MEEFGMFHSRYYAPAEGKNGVRKVTPTVGELYEYTPVSMLGDIPSTTRWGWFVKFAFGQACFEPVEEKTS